MGRCNPYEVSFPASSIRVWPAGRMCVRPRAEPRSSGVGHDAPGGSGRPIPRPMSPADPADRTLRGNDPAARDQAGESGLGAGNERAGGPSLASTRRSLSRLRCRADLPGQGGGPGTPLQQDVGPGRSCGGRILHGWLERRRSSLNTLVASVSNRAWISLC